MAAVQRKLVHKQFNSPIGLYSQDNVKDTLKRELKAFGSDGIEIDDQIARPLNLAHSEVLRAVEEEEQMKCEPVKCERQSRSRQRIYQQTHTPVHQQQLEQIKTQYLSHQHDITIDRDTVLKINRLATRRNLHKREHSWPPTTKENSTTTTISTHEHFNNVEKNGKSLRQEQHIRSTSIDNAMQFDKTVCKRHGIDGIREKFNSPTRIIEPTPQQLRQKREQQRRLQQQKQTLQQHKQCKTKAGSDVDSCEAGHGATTNKPKQMINLVKHEELLRKNAANKSATITDTAIAQRSNEKSDLRKNISTREQQSAVMSTEMEGGQKSLDGDIIKEDELFKTSTIPMEKGFSHPETKAADEDIGLVEPKRQFYEQLTSSNKWHSYDNLNALTNSKTAGKPLSQTNKPQRQACSLERGRVGKQHKQLPPQKPRSSPKLQRRCMKLATEIKISYENVAQQQNIQVQSVKHPEKPSSSPTSTTSHDDLEHIPLPATPRTLRKGSLSAETNTKFVKEQQPFDDSCIFLRSVDWHDNTVAYIPAAITIVPSPTEEILQHWMESSSLKANIKRVNDTETAKANHDVQNKNKNLISQLKQDFVKSVSKPEGIAHQRSEDEQQPTNAEAATYITRLPTPPNGIQLSRQTSVNTKRVTQMNNNNEDSRDSSNLTLTAKATTHESPRQARPPGVQHSDATTSTESNKVAKEGNKTQHQGVYYTDGEYVYGPYDHHNGTLLANATARSLLAEQKEKNEQIQQETEIKKDIEAETRSQHKNEIANLTAKYENIQKSINEHLRQIDAYIENAKVALKSTIATGNKPESSAAFQHSLAQTHYRHPQCSLKTQMEETQQEKAETETPLKEILRNITDIMQEVEPLYRNQKTKPLTYMPPTCKATQQDDEENIPIVDKVLIDLNMLTKHLSEFDKSSSEELKPIIEQLDLQFETRPTASTASHVLINEETANKENLMETGKNEKKLENAWSSTTPVPPTPPPPPPPPLPSHTAEPTPMTLTQPMQEKRTQQDADKQLLASDKLITAQTKNQQRTQQLPHQEMKRETTTSMSAVVPKDNDTTAAAAAAAADVATAKDKNKNFVFDFITERHEQEQLVEQVIDTLGKLENESQEKLVNTHVPAHDGNIKSNLSQQTPTSETTFALTNNMQKDVRIMQNCNFSVSPNPSGEGTCNHDNVSKSTKCNESQLKLHIKDFSDKKADKQYQKYDSPPTENTNDVVNDNVNNKNVLCQEHVSTPYHSEDEDKVKQIKEEEGASNHSSGSELSNTNKSSYELPSPYVTMRQISWEDVLSSATTNLLQTQQRSEQETATTSVLTKSVNIIRPEHEKEIAQMCTKSPFTIDKTESTASALTGMKQVMASGHVAMQSTKASKSHIHSIEQKPQEELKQNHQLNQLHRGRTPDEGRKYPISLIEPHLPTRATSPFGLNAIEMPFEQRSSSVSPTRLRNTRIADDAKIAPAYGRHELMQALRKYPSPLAEPHLPTRDTSPFGMNAVEMKNSKRSASMSPKRTKNIQCTSPRTVDEMPARKYPASLVEPHVPPRAVSPFGLNPVDVFHMTRATTPLPAYQVEVKSDNEPEQEYYDEHLDKPASPIRKYPPALIEPHVPTRAASPFGLNAVDTIQKSFHRTPSPHRPHRIQEAKFSKLTSTTSDSCKKGVVFVPQVEGHNIGLLVRTSTPTPYCHTDANHASSIHSEEMINATYTTRDYATATTRDITDNKYCAANDNGRDGEDDDATCDELQRINTIGPTKQVKQPKMHNLNTAGTTAATNKTMTHQLHQQHQPQLQAQEQHKAKHHLQYQEQYTGGGSGQHMPVDAISLTTSVINRSFDNVSPRPYISIEGYKRVAWPPASEERIVREFTPQPQTQTQPAPAYNQQYQPSAAVGAAAVPPTQGPSYNNTQHNTTNFARETSPPFKQNPNQIDYEAFPPQTPETPIILKDKQFSRLPSQEPNQTNTVPNQQYQQPQNQSMQQHQQDFLPQEQPQYQQPLYNQQNNQQQQHQYHSNQQSVTHTHHHQQQQQQQQQQYKMQEEHHLSGWKPIRPPQNKPDLLFTGHNAVRETTPYIAPPTFQQHYQNNHQPPTNQQQQYRAPSYDNYQQSPPEQQQQYPPQPQYQAQASQASQSLYQQPPQAGLYSQQPAWGQQQPAQQQPTQQQYQQPPWVQQSQQQSQPQYQQQYQPQQQSQYQNPLTQYNQAPHQQLQQQQQQQYPLQQNQFVPQTNQQQFNSYSQPQQQQHTVSHDQVDQQQQQHQQLHLSQDQRGTSPGIITLRKEAPITQKPAPVYTSQPAAISFRGGSNMRGDLKWPPPEYKEAAVKENEERRKLALGPVCRPRKVNRDYTSFFAKNALSHHYPSYKVPPGTQHMIN